MLPPPLNAMSNSSSDAHSPPILSSTPGLLLESYECDRFIGQPTTKTSLPTAGGSLDPTVGSHPWKISEAMYDSLCHEVDQHRASLPNEFSLPGRKMISRYLGSYFRGFHPHLPFLHLPTFSAGNMSETLVLAIAAVGAFYAFEHTNGYALYFASRAIISRQLEQRRRDSTFHLMRSFPPYAKFPTDCENGGSDPSYKSPQTLHSVAKDLDMIQALLVLVLTTSWLDGPLVNDALAMSSKLAVLVRDSLLDAPKGETESWEDWCLEEGRRRTVFAAYVVCNILTICFNITPQITVAEINLPLPCSDAEWKAATPTEWHRARRKGSLCELDFQECLRLLFSGQSLDTEVSVTAFGNYVLIQGLLQSIFFERQGSSRYSFPYSSLSVDQIRIYKAALSAWQSGWNSATESMIDPSSPHGPLAFNSTAVLRLAHIHLCADLGARTSLWSRNPQVLALAFDLQNNPFTLRSPDLEEAVLHAVYALRVPVRMGIAFVARTQTSHWSVQHAVSNFTSALLLTHWLESLYSLVAVSGVSALQPGEQNLVHMIEHLIEETHMENSLGPKIDYPRRLRRLAIAAVKLWAETCKGVQVFEIVHVIGATLAIVAENLENRAAVNV
ncbi:unnamed protein product [Penicillium salamii]|uniref:Xylanolytic transcriptional activator regulatory domain-containing protein n=1 Tax=Penicillium salamii TaxID=1612424 RepID=A0A9W4NI70_9EURO|nr:unnamed protein product [Penicillium salamii]